MPTIDLISKFDYEAEREIMADLCRESFWHFLLYAFGVANYMQKRPDNLWLNERVHRPLAEWFEFHVKDWLASRQSLTQPKKLMIVWPRGFGKTTIITKAGQLWTHLQDPELATVIDSVTTEKSWEFMGAIKDVMEGADPNAWFTQMYGVWRHPNRTWKNGRVVHALRTSVARSEASIEVSSVERGITGKHPDVVFIDDPVVQEKLTEELNWLEKVNTHVNALIPALVNNGLLVGTATRYHDNDWLGRYITEEGVRDVRGMMPRDFKFEVKEKGQWFLNFMRAKDDDDNPVLPEVHPIQSLDAYESKSPLDFSAQMMNEPGQGEHMPLTKEQIDRMYVEWDDIPKNLSYSIHCDTAFKSRDKLGKGDFNVIQVWGHAKNGSGDVYFVHGRRSNKWRVEDFGDNLVQILQWLKKEHGVRPFIITDEAAMGGKNDAFESMVQGWCASAGMYAPPVKILNRGGKKKEIRIREAANYWANGKVYLWRDAKHVSELVGEMLKIGVSAHDDMSDAAADVFHPEVYVPELVGTMGDQSPVIRRPYDEVLQLDPRMWSDQDYRTAYDAELEKEMDSWSTAALW